MAVSKGVASFLVGPGARSPQHGWCVPPQHRGDAGGRVGAARLDFFWTGYWGQSAEPEGLFWVGGVVPFGRDSCVGAGKLNIVSTFGKRIKHQAGRNGQRARPPCFVGHEVDTHNTSPRLTLSSQL